MHQAHVRQTLEEIKEFITFSEYLLNENPPLEEWYQFYTFEHLKANVPLYGEIQTVFLTKFANEWMNMEAFELLSLQPYQYESIHEMHVYYQEKRIGMIDIKRKEVTLFEFPELLTFQRKQYMEQYQHSKSYYAKRIQRKQQAASSLLMRLKERWNRNEFETETLQELLNIQKEIEEKKDKMPAYFEEWKIQFEVSERFLEAAKQQGFSVYKKEDVDACQLHTLYSDPKHEEYLNTLTHYRYVDLFGVKNVYGERQVILPKSEYLRHEHRHHLQHHLHISRRFFEAFSSNADLELLYVGLWQDDLETNEEQRLYEAKINKKGKEKQAVYLQSDTSIRFIAFRYKGFRYFFQWNGLIVSSKEGIALLVSETDPKEQE